jgi:hypothetical protein
MFTRKQATAILSQSEFPIFEEDNMNDLRPYRSFVSYMDRSREYYAAQGYTRPYGWAHFDDVPFAPLKKPLSECRVGLVTTAGRPQAAAGTIGNLFAKREQYADPSDPPPIQGRERSSAGHFFIGMRSLFCRQKRIKRSIFH